MRRCVVVAQSVGRPAAFSLLRPIHLNRASAHLILQGLPLTNDGAAEHGEGISLGQDAADQFLLSQTARSGQGQPRPSLIGSVRQYAYNLSGFVDHHQRITIAQRIAVYA